MDKMIYLDNAATTFPKPEVVYKAIDNGYRNLGVNIGRGAFEKAREASSIYDRVKRKLLNLSGLYSGKVIFTPSATVAFNQLIYSLDIPFRSNIYVTPFEHNAVMRPLQYYGINNELNIHVIPYDKKQKLIEDDFINQMCVNKPDYIFINQVSNVTGLIVEVERICELACEYNPIIIIDASQSLGLIPKNYGQIGADYIVFAGHKSLYGPFGIGGIISSSKGTLKRSLLHGGTGSDSLNINKFDELEVGSHNIMAILGLDASLDWIEKTGINNIFNHEKALTQLLIQKLNTKYNAEVYVSDNLDNHVGIVSFNIKDYAPDELGQILDQEFNIAVRTGYHCAPLVHDVIGTKGKHGTVRASFSWFNTEGDVEYLINCIEEL